MATRLARVPSKEVSCVMATEGRGRSLEQSEMELPTASNLKTCRKRGRKRRPEKKRDVIKGPQDDMREPQFRLPGDLTTEGRGPSSSNTCSRPADLTAVTAEAHVACCSPESSPRSPKEASVVEGYKPHSGQEPTSKAVDSSQPLVNLRHERAEEKSDDSSEPCVYRRKDSGVYGGRLKANPLRHLAALLRSKLLFHGNGRNLLELATEIHLEAKEKHNTTLRRIYDVVNVTEAAGLLERSVISRSGRKKAGKGSSLSGSLIRWCSSPATDAKIAEISAIRTRLCQKEEELKGLAEEVQLLENLMKYRKAKLASSPVTSADIASTSTQCYTNEHAVKSTSNQLLHSSGSVGIKLPFFLLKASKRSDDRNLEVCTYAHEHGTQFQVNIYSDHEIQPYEWRWILGQLFKISQSTSAN